LAASKKLSKHEELIGELGVLFSFPTIPLGTYIWGRTYNNPRLVNFAVEFASSMYLTLMESNLISFIHIHDRPDVSNLSKWETAFRSDSSFPSGHVVPYAILFFKGM
jgi:undecaprenyl-diphosphatase